MTKLMNALKGYTDFPLFQDHQGKWHFRYGIKAYGPFDDREAANNAYQNLLQHEGEH